MNRDEYLRQRQNEDINFDMLKLFFDVYGNTKTMSTFDFAKILFRTFRTSDIYSIVDSYSYAYITKMLDIHFSVNALFDKNNVKIKHY